MNNFVESTNKECVIHEITYETTKRKSKSTKRFAQRCISGVLSLILVAGIMPPGSRNFVTKAAEPPAGRTLSGMEVNVTVDSSWSDTGKYDDTFYIEMGTKYNSYNTEEAALKISTAGQLAAFAKFVNDGNNFQDKFVCLTDNIDLQGTAPAISYVNDGASGFKVVIEGEVINNWVPIGDSVTFNGTFDGGSHTISNMVLCPINEDVLQVGLFGQLKNGEIKNVGVKDSLIIIPNAYGMDIGGILGHGTYWGGTSTLRNCFNEADIFCDIEYTPSIGGITSQADNIINCYNSGNIFAFKPEKYTSAYAYIGGIAGQCNNTTNCYNAGALFLKIGGVDSVNSGAIAGRTDGRVSDCYYNKDIPGGELGATSQGTASNVKGVTKAELVEEMSTGGSGDESWLKNLFVSGIAGEPPAGRTLSTIDVSGVTVDTASSWENNYDQDFYNEIAANYSTSYNTEETALEIDTAEKFAAFAKYANTLVEAWNGGYKYVRLTADIDLKGEAPTVIYLEDGDDKFKVVMRGTIKNNWTPVSFYGFFYGDNHVISNMVAYNPTGGSALFDSVNEVNGVKVSGFVFGKGEAAGIWLNGYDVGVSNCFNEASIYAIPDEYGLSVGGIYVSMNAHISNCFNTGNIFAVLPDEDYASVGGICGSVEGVDNCYNSSKIYVSSTTNTKCYIGAIAGDTNGISDSYYDKYVAGDIDAVGSCYYGFDENNVKGVPTGEFIEKVSTGTEGDESWAKKLFEKSVLNSLGGKKIPTMHDFVCTLPQNLMSNGQEKAVTIEPRSGIIGMGVVTPKYTKLKEDGTAAGAASTTAPKEAGTYKVDFDVAAGSKYIAAKDLIAVF